MSFRRLSIPQRYSVSRSPQTQSFATHHQRLVLGLRRHLQYQSTFLYLHFSDFQKRHVKKDHHPKDLAAWRLPPNGSFDDGILHFILKLAIRSTVLLDTRGVLMISSGRFSLSIKLITSKFCLNVRAITFVFSIAICEL